VNDIVAEALAGGTPRGGTGEGEDAGAESFETKNGG